MEDWVTLAVFWVMVVCVFLQFFTRYVLNNSLAWTEEIAINALVVVVFLGSRRCACAPRGTSRSTCSTTICRRGAGAYLSLAVDVIRIVFFAYAVLADLALCRDRRA